MTSGLFAVSFVAIFRSNFTTSLDSFPICYPFLMEEEKLFWLAFSAFEGIGSKRFALLKNYFGSAKKAWEAKERDLLAVGLGPSLTAKLIEFRKKFDFRSYFLRLREKKIGALLLEGEKYPKSLKKIDNPPFVLYVKGEIKLKDDLALAVVGTRLMTGYGGQVTESLVTELVSAGLVIVSGLARGVDTIAHQSALKASGRTIGVLACGLDLCYPPENEKLVEEIIAGRGAVVSEFPLGSPPLPGNFPARNRIISGLSLGTVVIEGARRSGALITARHAAEQGREVFAVPGPVTSRFSAGPAHLIKMGAKLVFETRDILEELDLEPKISFSVSKKKIISESPEEEMLLSLIRDEGKHLDQLVRESGFDTAKVASIMTMLEIKGKVRNLGGMMYIVNR
jgi:DNA processing protein